ncbi:DUF6177 family protein [Streptomyces sp. NPDC048473]|uniref:DUF6177 family protein n=1 Tax=Streptomyces sp. NPDC048473 TaxID=3365556 RepID=UPI003713C2BB
MKCVANATSFTLGPGAVADLGLDHARKALADAAPTQLGPAARPALHYTLGDGTDPAARERLQQVNDHITGISLVTPRDQPTAGRVRGWAYLPVT